MLRARAPLFSTSFAITNVAGVIVDNHVKTELGSTVVRDITKCMAEIQSKSIGYLFLRGFEAWGNRGNIYISLKPRSQAR